MRLLFDQNLSYRLVRMVEREFPGSTHVHEFGLSRADDASIWAFARDRAYALVTHDADFPDFAGVYGAPPKVVWLRTGNVPTAAIAELLAAQATAITQFGADPELACLVLP